MSSELKMGRLSKDDWKYIRENVKTMPVGDIANHLKKSQMMVENWIRKNLALDVSTTNKPIPIEHNEIKNQLRLTSDWEAIQDQFVGTELVLFENKYARLMSQFRNDVTPTEEMQIIHLIKFDILMDRNLKSRSRALKDIERIEIEIDRIYSTADEEHPLDDKEKERLLNLESQLVAAREAEQSKTNEYVNLSGKHSILMKDMKATRDQRFTKIENSKETFLGLLKKLQDEEFRKQEGEDLQLMALAMETERNRLQSPHVYANGVVDSPLLTPEGASNEAV